MDDDFVKRHIESGYTRLTVQGDPYSMGWQHGCLVRSMRPVIARAIDRRLGQLESLDGGRVQALYRETLQLLEEKDPALLGMVRGQAEALEIEFDRLLRYDLAGLLEDGVKNHPVEGCTTWAAAGKATADGNPLLVKNRDSSLALLPLQIVTHAAPRNGYRYVSVGTAGSAGVYSAGMNQAGLAVADTYVNSTDLGPGLPDYSLMMHILENYDTVSPALDYLRSVPHLGRNNLILADAQGSLAVFEIGHWRQGVRETRDGFLVNTNHFVTPELFDCFVEESDPLKIGNSQSRYQKVTDTLDGAFGQIDVSLAQNLMATHGDQVTRICCHPLDDSDSATVSTVIFLPARRSMLFVHGMPCLGSYVLEEMTLQDGDD